jgi:hypothetical protein
MKRFLLICTHLILIAVCYIPASYFTVVSLYAWDSGTHFLISKADLLDLAGSPFILAGLLIMGTCNWLDGDKEGNMIWWLCGGFALVWLIFYFVTLQIVRRYLPALLKL